LVSGGSGGPHSGCKREIMEGGVRVPGLIQWPELISIPYKSRMPTNTYDIFPTVHDIISSLPTVNPMTTRHKYTTDGSTWDGESFKHLLATASSAQSSSNNNWNDDKRQSKHMVILAAYSFDTHEKDTQGSNSNANGWYIMNTDEVDQKYWLEQYVSYSLEGQYKYYLYRNELYDLWNNPRELTTQILDIENEGVYKNIADELRGVIETKMCEVKTDRDELTDNYNDDENSLSLCIGQAALDKWNVDGFLPKYAHCLVD